MSPNKDYLTKPELFMLDLLSTYQWDRPISVLNQGGDLNIGIKDYLMFDGYSAHLVPFKNKISSTDPGLLDTDVLYNFMTNVYQFDNVARGDYFVDYQNMYTHMGVMSIRGLFVNCSNAFIAAGENDRAIEMLDRCQEIMRPECYPLESIALGFSGNDYMVVQMISNYYKLGQKEKARKIAVELGNELLKTTKFYLEYYSFSQSEFELCCQYIYLLCDEVEKGGDGDIADQLQGNLNAMLSLLSGQPLDEGFFDDDLGYEEEEDYE
ncbi:MAG: hypothetical protein MJZ16_02610 [Bacteroidales bacterium]|nr:hypothetical protein [Bacteroidales bacterium]